VSTDTGAPTPTPGVPWCKHAPRCPSFSQHLDQLDQDRLAPVVAELNNPEAEPERRILAFHAAVQMQRERLAHKLAAMLSGEWEPKE
jgi:hypothetical protein